ncbi:MAG: [NiFe]-hydrogenase assembly chaperone HybE [Burkholderiaceae bacterium]
MTDNASTFDPSVATPLLPDPSPCLTAAYRSIAQRMDGLNFVNAAIEVEAVGFAPWESHWLGVMVTPWCINLMLLPRDVSAWTSLPQGEKLCYRFPAGDYDFISSRDETVGEYQMCSLISPVLELPDHATAREVAALARAALLDPANAPVPEVPKEAEDEPGTGAFEQLEKQAQAPMSKREFLRGRFLRGESSE